MSASQTTRDKAAQINEDPLIYGTFAEIGAGQEVARHFFLAGKASQTIAKTISAYDMIFSDEIYGRETNGRYVCESRLLKMLEKEFDLVRERLQKSRGKRTTFFAFANTVATGDQNKRQPHGWMGIRYQKTPQGPSNDIIMHVRMRDHYRLMQQEALGIIGVNLVSAAFKNGNHIGELIDCLVDNLKEGQVHIDMLRVSGPDLAHINNHLLNLELVRRGLAEAILFSPEKKIVSISDTLYGRPLVIERGTFRPLQASHTEILTQGVECFGKVFPEASLPLSLFEMTLHDKKSLPANQFDEHDFLLRAQALNATGQHVLVSKFWRFFSLKHYLRQYNKEPLVMIIGALLLPKLFDEQFYQDLEGGILEGLGQLLDEQSRILVYPQENSTSANFNAKSNLLPLYQYFQHNQWLLDIDSRSSKN